ncbi:CD209 antigen-like protein C isoform X1 [Pygocentrus nattereri]|uniref:CD209 antigen-like protein C isoform X1 n=1 Tax=Pygocentrus nattereri TaxID=42514 RepID=UPI000814A503|nr:CD209 antigen-like protein C isoform X1 [Pygocentrus nattereri]
MQDIENYTSLQEFTEDVSARGNKPILYPPQGRQGVVKGAECLRGQVAVVLLVALLASLCANIVLGVLLTNSRSSGSTIVENSAGSVSESASLSLKLTALEERFSRLCSDYTTLGQTCSASVRTCRPCPEGWTHLDGKCYYFSEDKLDWKNSKDSCASMGSHLTILHTHQQHDNLEKIARSIGGFDYHFWIGLSDSEEEGVWKWVDNTLVNKTYWNEWNQEPNNHESGGLHGEDCAVLEYHTKSWHDVPCDFLYKRICEMDAITVD